jgi:DNA-binding transcriptional LysR family regulator
MEMSQIRYALAAARTLNFTRAAGECHVSQPALTKAIRNLEAELGGPLFHREGKRVLLSDFGRSMLPHLQHIMDEAETAQALAANYRLLNKVPIRLGILSTVGHVRISRFLARFQSSFNGVEVAVEEGSAGSLVARLRDGELDLAMLNPIEALDDSLHALPLYSERYVVIVPPDHRLASAAEVRLGDLAGEAYVDRLACEMREMVMAVCRDRKIELYARFRSEREDWVQAMVAARIGFAFMPEYSVIVPDLLLRPLVDPEVSRTIALVSVPGRPYSPAVAAFVRAARSFAWPG